MLNNKSKELDVNLCILLGKIAVNFLFKFYAMIFQH